MSQTSSLVLSKVAQASEDRPRWDILVRLTHWAIAAAILINGVISEEGSPVHVWIGYAAGALLGLRLLWGVIGTRSARFSAFPPSPKRALAHIGDILGRRRRAYRSHNPLGALMVYALWGALATVVATGIAMDRGATVTGQSVESRSFHAFSTPYDKERESAGEGEKRDDDMLEEVHEIAANMLFLLAALHVAGVAFETARGEHGLVRAMITGRRPRILDRD